jgi:hypothetical protein
VADLACDLGVYCARIAASVFPGEPSGRPKNDGISKTKFVTAVTSSETGSVAPTYAVDTGNIPQPPEFSVAAEAVRPLISTPDATGPNRA